MAPCLVQIHNSSEYHSMLHIHMTSHLHCPLSSSMKLSSCTDHSSRQYKESVSVRSALVLHPAHLHSHNDFVNLLVDVDRIVLSFSTMPIYLDSLSQYLYFDQQLPMRHRLNFNFIYNKIGLYPEHYYFLYCKYRRLD